MRGYYESAIFYNNQKSNTMNFNHDAESSMDALGVNKENFDKHNHALVDKVIKSALGGDDVSHSRIAEFIHNNFDYAEILYMASCASKDRMTEAMELAAKEISKYFGSKN